MFDKVLLAFLGIFLILTGIFAVTNLQVAWSGPLCGFSALIAGVICIVKAIKSQK